MKFPSLYNKFSAFPPQAEFHAAYNNLRREALGQLSHPSAVDNFIMAGLRDHQKHRHDNFEQPFRHGKANCTIFGSGHPNSIHVSGCMTSYPRKHHSGPAHFAGIVGNPVVALERDLLAAELEICWKFPQHP
jgi:hypothetical protein